MTSNLKIGEVVSYKGTITPECVVVDVDGENVTVAHRCYHHWHEKWIDQEITGPASDWTRVALGSER